MEEFLFILSKSFKILTRPDLLLLLILTIGVILLWSRFAQSGRIVLSVCAVVLVSVSVLPFSAWWIGALEERFPRPDVETMEPPDGIIVLGGALSNPGVVERYGVISLNMRAERIVEFANLGRRFPDARMVFTGGTGDLRQIAPVEADRLKPFTGELGLEPGRVEYEEKSRNTWENALFSKEKINPKPNETWLLVTSAAHMPRSVGIFRKVGWNVTPYPVDYETDGTPPWFWFDPVTNWYRANVAAHETIGLIVYYLADRTSSLFPAPEPSH